ncbi:MAG: hypothetical protein JOZ16_09925 [Methylobacteriaceae bacterium]|nr:hypothetical protein [Methylobacteriaceae bacterium]
MSATEQSNKALLARIAVLCGEDPDEVINAPNDSNALSALVRKLLGVKQRPVGRPPDEQKIWENYFAIENLLAQGMSLQKAYKTLADHRKVPVSGIQKKYERLKRDGKAELKQIKLVDLFGNRDDLPPTLKRLLGTKGFILRTK